jgi:LDH2 family malate/lactate/ureidoglycolate dehydrogenase
MPAEEFKTRMDDELARLRTLRPVKGIKEVIYPGYKEHFTEITRREQGIPLAGPVVEETRAIGARHGIAFPV